MIHATKRVVLVAGLAVAAIASSAREARAQDAEACVAASEEAITLRKFDKLIESRAALSKCSVVTCPDAIRESCQQRLEQVNQLIPSLLFFVKDQAGHDISSVRVTVDGVPLPEGRLGSAIIVNTGSHEFRFDVAGQEPVVRRFVLHEGEQNRREQIVVGTAAVEAPTAKPGATPSPTAPTPLSPTPGSDVAPPTSGGGQRTVGYALTGVGAAGLIVGGIFGGLTLAAHSSYEGNCGSAINAPPNQCNAAGVSGQSSATTKGNVSTAALIAGGVLAATGVILIVTSPAHPSAPTVGMGPGSVWLTGQF